MKPQLPRIEAETLYNEGTKHLQTNQFEKALEKFKVVNNYFEVHQKWKKQFATQNRIAECYSYTNQFDVSIEYLHKNLAFWREKNMAKDKELVQLYQYLSSNYASKNHFEQAFQNINQSIQICETSLGKNHPIYREILNTKGWIYSKKQDFGQAIFYFEKVLPDALLSEDWGEIGTLYNNIAYNLKRLGEYTKAIEYYKKSIEALEQERTSKKPYEADSLITSLCNIGDCFFKMNQINDALNFYDQALKKSLKELGEKHVSTAKLYHSLGILYASQEDKEKSLFYHQKALILFEEMYGPHSSLVIATLYFMSECYRLTNDSYSALKYAKKALCRVLKTDKSSVREVLFKTIPIENNATEFKFSLNAVIVNSYFLYTKTGEIDYLLEAFDYQKYAIRLHQKILHYQMSQASNLQMAKQAQALYRIYLKIAFEMQTTFKQKNTKPSKKQTIKQLRERNHAKETFLIFEINNSLLLFSDVKNQNAKIKAQIPTALLQKEKQLQKQLATLEQKILQMQAKNKVKTISNELLQTKSQFANLKLQYTELIQKFETDYPQYHQLKRQVEIVPLENLQQKLPSDTALIEYFIGEKYLYTFVITCNDTQFLQSAKPDDFEELIEAFKASIDEIDKSEYLELAFELHELLIAPITNNNSPITSSQSPVTNLKIIPSGILSTIPFEALLTEEIQGNTKYADLPYLLLQYDISYHYSATLWSQSMDAERVETRPTFVGFAPVYKSEQEQTLEETTIRGIYNNETTRSVRIGEETYSELIHSEEEVNSIQSYFNAKNIPTQTFLHAQANSNNFLQNVGKHKYVLISAHGFYNEKQPDLTGIILSPSINQTLANPSDVAKSLTAEKKASIRAKNSPSSELPLWRGQGEVNGDVWSENIFYLSDAYNLELNADLVVLSCCETGVGKLAKGEGVMALNRGFFYAGAKNVIYTLFKVYDQASCQLTKHLFQQILKSKPYALALKEAKRQLILQGKAPIHWAGYLLIGE